MPADLGPVVFRRAARPLGEGRLRRLFWRWDSAEQMQAALAAAPDFPQARAAMSLTRDATAVDGEIVDER